jgi:hypothetical protein
MRNFYRDGDNGDNGEDGEDEEGRRLVEVSLPLPSYSPLSPSRLILKDFVNRSVL